ncbi:glycosyltransferase family 4 protein [Spiribacter sp. 1M153]|uniref:glycosyltransferase family 4 protein n=1 Tax=Spiribacter roseus TaxID=1855875 RepID=UPI00349F3DAD
MTDLSPNGSSFPPTAIVCLSPNHGGMEISSYSLASTFSRQGEDCLFIVRRGSWLEKVAKELSLNHVAIDMRRHFSVRGIRQIRKAFSEHGTRLVIYAGSSEMRTLRFCMNKNIERFVVRHGTPKSNKKRDLVHKMLWSKVTHHMAISESMRANVAGIFPVGERPMFVNYVSQEEKLKDLSLPREIDKGSGLSLAQIARIERVKGQFDALEVLNRLRKSGVNADLTFYGAGRDLSALEEEVKLKGLDRYVSFKGQIEAPYRCLRHHHVFLYPSHSEGFGNSFAEALSTGMHCICYNNTSLPEYRALGFDYKMVETGNVDGVVGQVLEIWENVIRPPLENREVAKRVFSEKEELTRIHRALYQQNL